MRRLTLLLLTIALCAFFVGCTSSDNKTNGDGQTTPTPTAVPTENAATPTEAPATSTPTPQDDPTPTPTVGPHAKIDNHVPTDYSQYRLKNVGSIVEITYESRDYLNDPDAVVVKPAFVYLPPNYDETKQYNVLYLMHGIGGNESEWGMTGLTSIVKAIMDNLIRYGDIEPFIVVTPNGRSYADFANTSGDSRSFYVFGQELRNDLIPYMESHFAVYHDDDMTAVRDHRAMAGLSMGGMQTINIGMCECLDILSWFGTFSAAPTSYPANQIAEIIGSDKFKDYKINYMYNICGLQDKTAYWSASAAAKDLPSYTDKLKADENFMWQELNGVHDFGIWYLGFYNFAQLVFK